MLIAAAAPLRYLTSAGIRMVACPTCGAQQRMRCASLRDRPMESVHRGRASKYLQLRFGIGATQPRRQVRAAPLLDGPGLSVVTDPHPQPWRLPLAELGALVDTSFLDLSKVVAAEAAGLGPHALTGLLYGRDRIRAAIDALCFAEHDTVLRRERHLLAGLSPHHEAAASLSERARQVHVRRQEAESELRRQRTVALQLEAPGAYDNTPIDDPKRLAMVWLGRYLHTERAALLDRMVREAGICPAAAVRVRTKEERVQRCVARGLLIAPVTASVQDLREMDDDAFDRHVLREACAVSGRDDDLAHPLVVERWLQALDRVRPVAAAAALSPCDHALAPLAGRHQPPAAGRAQRLLGRRALFAALVQRTGEAQRTRHAVQDAVTIAEHRDGQTAALKRVGEQANIELARRNRDLYQVIRAQFDPHQTRYGRLRPLDANTRRALKRQVWAELDAAFRRSPRFTAGSQ